MTRDYTAYIENLDDLADAYQEVLELHLLDEGITSYDESVATLEIRLWAAIDRMAPANSAYRHAADEVDMDWPIRYRVRPLYATVNAIRQDMKNGWFESIEALAHGDAFNDLLSQAKELLDNSFAQAAAVISGCALETHLRQLCDKAGIPIFGPDGKRIKVERMRSTLLSQSKIKDYEARQVAVWLNIRNSAAHSEADQFDPPTVNSMIEGIGTFIERYPA
jgi:hypothetical protein